jgi:protein TonB
MDKPAAAAATGPAPSASYGARALNDTPIKVPDELQDDALKYRATVSITVAADGSATVELAKPTPNPSLNRLYLEHYKNVKYFPATQDGKPVSSTFSIAIAPPK